MSDTDSYLPRWRKVTASAVLQEILNQVPVPTLPGLNA